MHCEWAKENLILYVYDELADDARHELEQHLERCTDCAEELKTARGFHEAMSVTPAAEPAPNLVAASRMRLQEALETTEQHKGWRRWTFDLGGWIQQVRFSPALAVLLLMFGFAGGVMTTWRPSSVAIPPTADSSTSAVQSSVAGIREISREPGSKNVQIQYETTVPQSVQGSIDDPKIQQLLLFAARNNYNSGVRMDSVDLLAQKPSDENVREALMSSLRYDNNPGVRLKALDGLGAYVKQDIRVRNAVLEALMNDSNPGVRSEAITLLQPVRADSSVRQVLELLAKEDKNQFIRSESKRVLASIPEID
ncbi:MAG: HEAT repeat domain-containing protein [Acidobacteriaceae bacterium]|nr:HEAT repeat domain-containing protein [Acidobacteriaceae bacterium]